MEKFQQRLRGSGFDWVRSKVAAVAAADVALQIVPCHVEDCCRLNLPSIVPIVRSRHVALLRNHTATIWAVRNGTGDDIVEAPQEKEDICEYDCCDKDISLVLAATVAVTAASSILFAFAALGT